MKVGEILKKHSKHIFFMLLGIFAFFTNKDLFMFFTLALASAIFNYYHDRKNKTVFDFRLGLVLGIIIARHYGLGSTLIFYLLSFVMPNLFAGGRVDGPSLVFHVITVIIFGIVSLVPTADIIIFGIVICLIEGFVAILVNSFLGVPYFMSVTAAIVTVSVRIVYFLVLGPIIEMAFQFAI